MARDPAGSWYLPAAGYWVPANTADAYPARQGDLFGGIEVNGESWLGGQLVHPTCELTKRGVSLVQTVRVRALAELRSDHQRAAVTAGWQERDGRVLVAFAHTFWLAPVPGATAHGDPMFADLRDVALVERERLLANRIAALTHDARVSFIRRKLYFEQRWNLSYEDVLALEAARITADRAFVGPRPPVGDVNATSAGVDGEPGTRSAVPAPLPSRSPGSRLAQPRFAPADRGRQGLEMRRRQPRHDARSSEM